LLTKQENPQPCQPIAPREDDKIERLFDQDHKQNLHAENMEPGNSKIQQDQ